MNTEQARDLLAEWARQGQEAAPPAWEELPGIPLYMDQVILYLGESLELFQREGSSLLTSSMINNYVKTGLIPHPDKKKYTKEHLAGLMAVCMLKQVLPIPDVKTLLESQFEGAQEQTDGGAEKRGFAKAFDCFCTLQETAFADMARQAAQLETAAGTRPALAMEMAVRANASKRWRKS